MRGNQLDFPKKRGAILSRADRAVPGAEHHLPRPLSSLTALSPLPHLPTTTLLQPSSKVCCFQVRELSLLLAAL